MSYWNRYALAVDDDPQCVNTLRLTLRFCGFHHIVAAEDGFVALEYLKEWRFDLIVSDWNMGTMDGVELLMRVRRDPTTANVPFILVTASLTEPPWRGAIEQGATEFLLKPFTLGALRSACHLCLELKEFEGANVTPLRAPRCDEDCTRLRDKPVRLSSERRAEFAELAAEARALVLPQPHARRAAIISATRRRAQSRSAVSISSMHAVFDQRCVAVAEIDDCSLPCCCDQVIGIAHG